MRAPRETAERISIHALREEGDANHVLRMAAELDISIHALREEGDPHCSSVMLLGTTFLSTPSARRATAP